MNYYNVWVRPCTVAIMLGFLFGLPHPVRAQQAGQASAAGPQSQAKSTNDSATANDPPPLQQSPKPENDRIFWALPNFLTVEKAPSLPPLTTGQKFSLVAKGTFDPVEFGFVGIVASINQASNSNPTFRQGLEGYAKRYGLAFTDNTIENFMVGAVYPSLLRQDPRYYQLGKGRFAHRAAYAALRVFLTRSDSGKTQFNFSEILGSGMAAAISNAYHPGPRTLGSNMSIWWTQVGWDTVSFELKEFWPDIRRHFRHGSDKT